jgi:hypothetical protein
MHAHEPGRGDLVPVTAVAVIAIVGAAALYWLDFAAQNELPRGISMITASVVEQAGAIALPTPPAR